MVVVVPVRRFVCPMPLRGRAPGDKYEHYQTFLSGKSITDTKIYISPSLLEHDIDDGPGYKNFMPRRGKMSVAIQICIVFIAP